MIPIKTDKIYPNLAAKSIDKDQRPKISKIAKKRAISGSLNAPLPINNNAREIDT